MHCRFNKSKSNLIYLCLSKKLKYNSKNMAYMSLTIKIRLKHFLFYHSIFIKIKVYWFRFKMISWMALYTFELEWSSSFYIKTIFKFMVLIFCYRLNVKLFQLFKTVFCPFIQSVRQKRQSITFLKNYFNSKLEVTKFNN